MAYDIVIDEVSLMRSYRKQFKRIMKRDGFDVLIEKMSKKINDGAGEIDDP
jgi:ABC-type transporter MlaC component